MECGDDFVVKEDTNETIFISDRENRFIHVSPAFGKRPASWLASARNRSTRSLEHDADADAERMKLPRIIITSSNT